jgi:hypothetical protein
MAANRHVGNVENDPTTPESGLSDRSTESSTQRTTSAVIFDSVAPLSWQLI